MRLDLSDGLVLAGLVVTAAALWSLNPVFDAGLLGLVLCTVGLLRAR